MRIFGLCFDDQTLAFRSFGLHIVLPEKAFLLATTGSWCVFVVRVCGDIEIIQLINK